MQKVGILGILVGGVMMSTAAFAQQTGPAAAPATPTLSPDATSQAQPAAAPADDPNEIVCHAGEPILGSRFPGPRTCHTRKEWSEIQKESQDALYHQQMERAANGGH